MAPRPIRPIALLLFVVLAAGCGSTLPEPRGVEPPLPVEPVDGADYPPIRFQEVTADVPGKRIIGWHYEGEDYRRVYEYRWDENFANVTTTLNAPALELLHLVGYRVATDGRDAVSLKGILKKVGYNSYARREPFNQGEVTVVWSLIRPGEETAYYTATTEGIARVEDIQGGAVAKAVLAALQNLLADPEFLEALGRGAAP